MPSRVLTIMFTDIKGFTERTSRTSREDLRNLLEIHEKLLFPIVEQFKGKVVKTIGDALLVTFDSPTNAVLCGLMMQEALNEFNIETATDEPLQVRISINSGEVEIRDGDIFGEAVNIAARIEGITEANEIYFTESVYLAMNKAEVPSSEVGEHRLKGIPEAIKIYRVIQDRNSDKHQQLVERLRTAQFEDVAFPTTGEGKRGIGAKPWFKPVLFTLAGVVIIGLIGLFLIPRLGGGQIARDKEMVLDAVANGDLGLALTRADSMIENYPQAKESHEAVMAVVEGEAAALMEEGRYDDALALVESRGQERTYLKLRPLKKTVLLSHADYMLDNNHSQRFITEVYNKIANEYPKDTEALMKIIEKVGADYGDGGSWRVGVYAAYLASQNSQDALEDVVGRTLIDGLRREGAFGNYAKEIRVILSERYPKANDLMKEKLSEEHYDTRINAYYLLKEGEVIDPQDELRYHIYNLITLTSSYRKVGEEAIAYLNEASEAEDWKQRKKAAAIAPIPDVRALHSWSDYQRKVSDLLVKVFLPEIEAVLLEWVEGDDEHLRTNAYNMLSAAGKEEVIDQWKFHAKTLVNFNTQFIPRHFKEAVSFFGEKARSQRSAEALKSLKAGQAYLEEHVKSYEKRGAKGWADTAKESLEEVEKTLDTFR